MRKLIGGAWIVAAWATASFPIAHGDTLFNDGGTHTINSALAPTVIVSAPQGATTVNVVAGASVAAGGTGVYGFRIDSGGLLNVSGGTIAGGVKSAGILLEGGTANIIGGFLSGGSVNGGGLANALFMTGGQLYISGGTFTGGAVTSGGGADALFMNGGAAAITGGTFTGGTVAGGGGSNAVLVGGGSLTLLAGSLNASNGPAGSATAALITEGGHVTVLGGTLRGSNAPGGFALLAEGGVIDLKGGALIPGTAPGIDMQSGVVNIYGYGFNHPFGAITSGNGTISGFLSDGSPLNTSYAIPFSNTSINLISLAQPVPLPAAFPAGAALLAAMGLASRLRTLGKRRE